MEIYGIINSNVSDLKFLRAGLAEFASAFAHIVVALGNDAWDGTPEDSNAIDEFCAWSASQAPYPERLSVVTYDVNDASMDKQMRQRVSPPMYWEAHARRLALTSLYDKFGLNVISTSLVMLLDSDEIVEAAGLLRFVEVSDWSRLQAVKLANYWYWRLPTLRAKAYTEDSVVLVQGRHLGMDGAVLFSDLGRHGVVAHVEALCGRDAVARQARGPDGRPIVHHYSWVRTREEMLVKVSVWGHCNDRPDWKTLVEKEFDTPFKGTDFLRGLTYERVPNQFGIELKDPARMMP
jgi:hypothetical protein